MRYDLVIFDLDGTILDTLDDLTDAINRAVAERGHPTHSREAVRLFVGNGALNSIRMATPEGTGEGEILEILARFKALYLEHVNDKTRPFPGIHDLLTALKARGIRLAVNSNKPDAATRKLCDIHYPGLFDRVMGERSGIPRKPAPDGARRIMAELGVDPARTLYVGDSDTDLRTAKSAGVAAAWVRWGYRRREELGEMKPDHSFDTPEALAAFVCATT